MKYINKYIMLFLLLVPMFAACDDDLAQPPVNLPEGGVGTGKWDNPMTAYQALLGSVNDNVTEPWVKGYIVGYIDTGVGNTANANSAKLTADGAVATNMLIATTPDETDWQKCATVQLPSGPVRSALNLANNPGNLGKLVTIKGTTGSKYCGVYGVRSVSAYKWGEFGIEGDDNEKPDTPDTPTPSDETIYSALGASETELSAGWTIENVNMPEALSYIWTWKEYNGNHYLNASAYMGGQAYASEAYAYSGEIDLTSYKNASVTFEHAAKFQTTIKELCAFVVRESGSTAWTKLEIPEWPGTTSWAFVNSGVIDLSTYAGKKIQVGFKYGSSTTGADTWEIKNIVITGSK